MKTLFYLLIAITISTAVNGQCPDFCFGYIKNGHDEEFSCFNYVRACCKGLVDMETQKPNVSNTTIKNLLGHNINSSVDFIKVCEQNQSDAAS